MKFAEEFERLGSWSPKDEAGCSTEALQELTMEAKELFYDAEEAYKEENKWHVKGSHRQAIRDHISTLREDYMHLTGLLSTVVERDFLRTYPRMGEGEFAEAKTASWDYLNAICDMREAQLDLAQSVYDLSAIQTAAMKERLADLRADKDNLVKLRKEAAGWGRRPPPPPPPPRKPWGGYSFFDNRLRMCEILRQCDQPTPPDFRLILQWDDHLSELRKAVKKAYLILHPDKIVQRHRQGGRPLVQADTDLFNEFQDLKEELGL